MSEMFFFGVRFDNGERISSLYNSYFADAFEMALLKILEKKGDLFTRKIRTEVGYALSYYRFDDLTVEEVKNLLLDLKLEIASWETLIKWQTFVISFWNEISKEWIPYDSRMYNDFNFLEKIGVKPVALDVRNQKGDGVNLPPFNGYL